MAALLMAIYLQGLDREETRHLTIGMRDSGDVLQFPDDHRPLVDKHSTGGTLDKMESIPGCRTALSPREIVDQVQSVGCVLCGQTQEMIPADRILYAMRDVTGTICSIPLITSSILSKQLAENIGSLLLDVKFGRAAFMKSSKDGHDLAFA